MLDEPQLAAVLAPERAHLRAAVTCLAELAADDAAARSAGRRVLATGTGILSGAVPGNSLPGLAAAAYAVRPASKGSSGSQGQARPSWSAWPWP